MLAIRLDSDTERALESLARAQHRTRSDVVREAIRSYLAGNELAAEARRQSLRVSESAAEHEFMAFAADLPDEP